MPGPRVVRVVPEDLAGPVVEVEAEAAVVEVAGAAVVAGAAAGVKEIRTGAALITDSLPILEIEDASNSQPTQARYSLHLPTPH
jgi:hypothetical protein